VHRRARHRLEWISASKYSFNATTLLCALSFAAKSRVRVRAEQASSSCARASPRSSSSRQYLCLKETHLDGSWPNHLRSSELGATSLIHASSLAASFERPRGQIRSTSTRQPSERAGGS